MQEGEKAMIVPEHVPIVVSNSDKIATTQLKMASIFKYILGFTAQGWRSVVH